MPGLISLDDLDANAITRLADRAVALHNNRLDHDRPLEGKVAGILFLQTSTRTRTAFSVGAMRLGADIVNFGPQELQLATGESVEDTGRMFAVMLDLLVVRTKEPMTHILALSDRGQLPTINAMSREEHPTQGINDLAALRLRLGDLTGLKFLYVGEGNNSAVALAKVLRHVPSCDATFWTPPGYGVNERVIKQSHEIASRSGGAITQITAMDALPRDVDVVYTTRWQTTGTSKADPSWKEIFRPYYVDATLIRRWPQAIIMHDLPAHRGEEISTEILDGQQSIAWVQGAMKMASAMAALERAALGTPAEAASS